MYVWSGQFQVCVFSFSHSYEQPVCVCHLHTLSICLYKQKRIITKKKKSSLQHYWEQQAHLYTQPYFLPFLKHGSKMWKLLSSGTCCLHLHSIRCPSTLKTEAADSSETSVLFYQVEWCHIWGNSNLNWCESSNVMLFKLLAITLPGVQLLPGIVQWIGPSFSFQNHILFGCPGFNIFLYSHSFSWMFPSGLGSRSF